MTPLAVIGGGSWGTALSIALAARFPEVRLWIHDSQLAQQTAATRENQTYLPGFALPPNVRPVSDLEAAVRDARIALGVMPSQYARGIYRQLSPLLSSDAIVVSATKGIEQQTLRRMSEVASEELPSTIRVVVLSGPNFAREVAQGQPTATVLAAADHEAAASIQSALAGRAFRLYTNRDPVGVEIGAALKNVIALAAGVCHGLGLGSNTTAALVTRGLAEISRLAVALGGSPLTLAGLAGLGDLVLTCYGALSRNRQVGIELAKGRAISEITNSMKMVAEGVSTTHAALLLAKRERVDLPITQQMASILDGTQSPREAVQTLMERELKSE